MRFDRMIKAWGLVVQAVGGTTRSFASLFGGLFFGSATGGILTALTQAATVALDASLGNEFFLNLTTNVAFILGNPANPPPAGQDQIIIVTYSNTAGVAHGAGTFDTLYKTSAGFAAVATGFQRSIAFRWNGTNWVELWRTAADVAN